MGRARAEGDRGVIPTQGLSGRVGSGGVGPGGPRQAGVGRAAHDVNNKEADPLLMM